MKSSACQRERDAGLQQKTLKSALSSKKPPAVASESGTQSLADGPQLDKRPSEPILPGEVSQVVTMKDMFGPVVELEVLNKLSRIQGVVQDSLQYADLESPSHLQTLVLGKNLLSFRDAQYVDPLMRLSSPASASTSSRLQEFLGFKKRRRLYPTYMTDKATGLPTSIGVSNYSNDTKTLPSHEKYSVPVEGMGFDITAAQQFGKQLKSVLQRIPTFLRLLSQNQKQWAFYAALKLAFENNENFSVFIEYPQYYPVHARSNIKSHSFVSVVHGYDPPKNQAWRELVSVPVGSLNIEKPLDVGVMKHVKWTGQDCSPRDMKIAFSEEQFAYGKLLSQYIAATACAFVGTRRSCINEVASIIRRHWLGSDLTRCPEPAQIDSLLPWNGQKFFTFAHTIGDHTTLRPMLILNEAMTGGEHAIVIDSRSPEKVYPVVQDMLEALKSGVAADDVWGIGCARADYKNEFLETELPIISCTISSRAHGAELHLCPDCLDLVTHDSMQQDQKYRSYAICTTCWHKWEYGSNDGGIRGGALGLHLYKLLEKENSHVDNPKTVVQLKQEQNEIWEYLMLRHKRDTNVYEDSYIDQDLLSHGPREQAWDGSFLNPQYPSFEALDPVVEGPDGKTAYHIKENFAMTADAINRAKRHYQMLVLYAVRLMRDGLRLRDKEMYDSGISIFRIGLVNHYAYGELGRVHQTSRIAKDLPENFDQICESFRNPKVLLEQNVSDQHLFRYVSQPLPGKRETRAAWRHKYHDWLYNQLKKVATRVFGHDYDPGLRGRWMRKSEAGEEVFFPFSSEYSIVEDWTE